VFSGEVEIGGALATREGLKGSRIVLRRKSRAAGPLVGGDVRLEVKATAEDIYADTVELEEKSEARRVFARRVVLGDGATVDLVTFTESVESGSGARIRSAPQKVTSLPTFPL